MWNQSQIGAIVLIRRLPSLDCVTLQGFGLLDFNGFRQSGDKGEMWSVLQPVAARRILWYLDPGTQILGNLATSGWYL